MNGASRDKRSDSATPDEANTLPLTAADLASRSGPYAQPGPEVMAETQNRAGSADSLSNLQGAAIDVVTGADALTGKDLGSGRDISPELARKLACGQGAFIGVRLPAGDEPKEE